MNYQRHFLSACWPEISGEDFEYLKDSISTSGLRDSIVLLDGEILDGWNRYRACQATGMEPHFVPYGGDDPSQYVRDKHTRRSLTLTQRLACIGLMATWAPSSRPNKGAPGAPLLKKDLAKQAGSSERTAQQVMSVIKSGDAETIKEMIDGTLSAKAADAKVKGHAEKPSAKPAPVVEPIAEEPEDYTELDAAQDLANERQHVIESLRAEIAIKHMDGTEEEKQQAAALIAELQAENKTLTATLRAVTLARDSLMEETNQMKRQMAMQRKEIDRLKNNK